MALKNRIHQLEKRFAHQNPLPFVVRKMAGETEAEAIERTLKGRRPPKGWCFVIAPPALTLEEWKKKYSPQSDVLEVHNSKSSWEQTD